MARDTILFDINETVLDLGLLREKFEATFGDASAVATWFSMLLHSSTVCALTGVKATFAELADTMLTVLAARKGVAVSNRHRDGILQGFAQLKAHPDMHSALRSARAKGYRTIAFTNSSRALVESQLSSAGLAEHFDAVISVEEAGSFKPDPAVYLFAARRLDRVPANLRLVAAHDWDTHGAMTAGLMAAYLDRTGAPYHRFYRRPDVCADNMGDLIESIAADDEAAKRTS